MIIGQQPGKIVFGLSLGIDHIEQPPLGGDLKKIAARGDDIRPVETQVAFVELGHSGRVPENGAVVVGQPHEGASH